MLMYGTATNIITDKTVVFNITSLREGFPKLVYLIPPNNIGLLTGRDFDMHYAEYIMNNDYVFFQFFTIINELYNGNNVYLVISDDEWSENLIESLLKLIQARYGYNGIRINTYQDFLDKFNSKYQESFNTSYGLLNLDEDKTRFGLICETEKIRRGIQNE